MTDEEKVRSVWELVASCDGSYRDYSRGTILVQDVNHHWFDFPSWSAAAAYTDQVLEEARQMREEMEACEGRIRNNMWSVKASVGYSMDGIVDVDDIVDDVRRLCLNVRILRRLQTLYAAHVCGIKPEALK